MGQQILSSHPSPGSAMASTDKPVPRPPPPSAATSDRLSPTCPLVLKKKSTDNLLFAHDGIWTDRGFIWGPPPAKHHVNSAWNSAVPYGDWLNGKRAICPPYRPHNIHMVHYIYIGSSHGLFLSHPYVCHHFVRIHENPSPKFRHRPPTGLVW